MMEITVNSAAIEYSESSKQWFVSNSIYCYYALLLSFEKKRIRIEVCGFGIVINNQAEVVK